MLKRLGWTLLVLAVPLGAIAFSALHPRPAERRAPAGPVTLADMVRAQKRIADLKEELLEARLAADTARRRLLALEEELLRLRSGQEDRRGAVPR